MVDAREYHERTSYSPERLRERDFEREESNRPRPDKTYEDLPRVSPNGEPDPPETPALAAVATDGPAPPAAATDADGDPDIGTLCHYAAGITTELEIGGERYRYRAAACTGALYHVDCYAVAGDCGAFSPGVYHFDPQSGEFDVLREGDYRGVLQAASGDHSGVADAPVTFVATSQWWRNAWKYRDRTYRHAFWDAGTVLANLLAVAHGGGHRAEIVAGFADDPVVELLGLDPDEEAPLALAPVGSGSPVAESVETPDVDPIDPAERPLSEDPVDYPLVSDAWRGSRLEDGDAAAAWRGIFVHEVADASLGERADDAEWVDLDPVDAETASARPVGNAIERRGSCREYSREPISARKFATVMDRALGGVPADAFAGDLRGLVDCYCLVHAVSGIESGVYEYHPGTDELERVRETDRERAGELALGQDVVGDAAVNVYLVADVDAVVSEFGNRGYRLAQLEAGVVLGRLYLATYAHRSLGGRGFTFFDTEVAEYLAPHADGQTPMTLFAFGKPA
ncbi:SagB-type dehydrogenase domain protein [Halosimplex carlsbadense 2-9-1]|uniref:SagB-type dehydrogenase domain protein n=1 Tax=Halosimplex carlsbadense 2-9-1 TaxID=797114 RepID=M0CCB7_9EURY|nr:SagB/ThcOx family dehydrogenase [Halosimplex carlsbadense]ELZ20288.1 SagB-type dehydrogenase domain protein [Halosimplex carlsbadense 2-9-1]